MKKCVRLGMLALTVGLMGTVSCSKDDQESNELGESNLKDPVLKALFSQGWDIEKTKVFENGDYLIGGDIIASGNIKDYEDINQLDVPSKQVTVRNLINIDKYDNIRVFIHSSVTLGDNTNTDAPNEDNWTDATRNAITIWNSVANSGLRFVEVFTLDEADTVIVSDEDPLEFMYDLPNDVLAAAMFPVQDGSFKGLPGLLVAINLDAANNAHVGYDVRLNNMVHELGHIVGLRHTNYQEINDGNASFGTYLVPGTPDADPNSVMNANTANNGFRGLSKYDKVAIAYWYPNK